MGMPFISTTTTGTALTVRGEHTISPVLCMILPIEALKTQIDGPTLSRAREAISHITICPRFMEPINSEESASSSKSVNAINRLDSIMRLIFANILRSSDYISTIIGSL